MAKRIALIGAGMIGKRHAQAIAGTDRATLAAIADPDPAAAAVAQAQGVPFFTDIGAMLGTADPDGVIVASPTEHHLSPSLAALRHGCHVLIEKPIAASNAEAADIVAASAAAGRHVLVAHQRRHYPNVARARDLIRDGRIGTLVGISGLWAVRKHPEYYAPDWRRRWQAGPVMTNMVHEMDYLRHICGEVAEVTARTANTVQGFQKEDAAAILIRFESGALGSFLLSDQADSPWSWEQGTGESQLFPRSGQNSIRFMGTEGALEFPNLRLWTSDGAPHWMTPMRPEDMVFDLGDAYVRQIEHFAAVMAGDTAPMIPAADGARSLAASLAVLESARTGQSVRL